MGKFCSRTGEDPLGSAFNEHSVQVMSTVRTAFEEGLQLGIDTEAAALVTELLNGTVGREVLANGPSTWDAASSEFVTSHAGQIGRIASRLATQAGSDVVRRTDLERAVTIVFDRARRAERRLAA